ncbi:hypothetical protein [Bacillus weihaiensis]|uniref:hypothetical protein n=1 Tax=Bacillus weihaiensis TaxID=1547283 RepID=UPI002355AC2C|nr:hypothetical protein [Bacillus weihaiensis]
MERNSLAHLICGDYTQHKSIENLYKVLFHNISNMETRLGRVIINGEPGDLTVLGPYYARNLIETTCSALLGRIDPFRLIYVQKVQSVEGFNIGSKAKGAISWSGDIFEKNETNASNLWHPDREFNKVGRAFFGNHYSEIFWNPAFKSLIDDTNYLSETSLEYFRTHIESPDKFTMFLRQKSSTLYSSLSKGIHSELVIKPEIVYDDTTVIELVNDTFQICSILGIVSHYIDFSICRLPIDNAFQYYNDLFEWRENNYE